MSFLTHINKSFITIKFIVLPTLHRIFGLLRLFRLQNYCFFLIRAKSFLVLFTFAFAQVTNLLYFCSVFRASIHAQKKCELLFCILGNSGFDSYRLQYKQKVHTYVRTLAISRKSITICRRLNYSSIKLMFIMIHACINIFYVPS